MLGFQDDWYTDKFNPTEKRHFTSSTETPPAKKSKMIPWKPVSIPEMKTFIGLCFAMGIVRLPVRRDYWRLKKPLFTTAFPHHMSRDRFADIWR